MPTAAEQLQTLLALARFGSQRRRQEEADEIDRQERARALEARETIESLASPTAAQGDVAGVLERLGQLRQAQALGISGFEQIDEPLAAEVLGRFGGGDVAQRFDLKMQLRNAGIDVTFDPQEEVLRQALTEQGLRPQVQATETAAETAHREIGEMGVQRGRDVTDYVEAARQLPPDADLVAWIRTHVPVADQFETAAALRIENLYKDVIEAQQYATGVPEDFDTKVRLEIGAVNKEMQFIIDKIYAHKDVETHPAWREINKAEYDNREERFAEKVKAELEAQGVSPHGGFLGFGKSKEYRLAFQQWDDGFRKVKQPDGTDRYYELRPTYREFYENRMVQLRLSSAELYRQGLAGRLLQQSLLGIEEKSSSNLDELKNRARLGDEEAQKFLDSINEEY